MRRNIPLTMVMASAAVVLASCDDNTPTQPDAVPAESSAAPEFALASNRWVAKPPVPTGRADHVAAVVNNPAGEPVLYVVGGVNQLDQAGLPVEAFNYATNSWQRKQTNGGPVQSNGVGVIGGKLYISGGVSEHGEGLESDNTLVAYDPVRDAFTLKANMPRHTNSGVTGVVGGKLYVLVGFCSDCTHSVDHRLFRYDPATDTWNTSLSWAPHPHALGAGGVIKGKFYVAGGSATDPGGAGTTNLDVYDPATNKWKTLAPLPFPIVAAAGAVIQNQLYVIGSGHRARSVVAYNPTTNTWKEKNALPTGRINLAAASFVTQFGNPKILAVGGRGRFTPNELYTP
jgi:N-acetylneuraminic acid mutarotase